MIREKTFFSTPRLRLGRKVIDPIMSPMEIKKVSLADLPQVMGVINDAKAWLRPLTTHQWQYGYPNENTMRKDIEIGALFGVYEGKTLLAIVALIKGWNPDYETLYDGKWDVPHTAEDLVMHRIAVKDEARGKGLGHLLFEFAEEVAKKLGCPSIKIDTHLKNLPMRKLCEDHGYTHSGTIILRRGEPNSERMLFEKRTQGLS